MNIFFIFLFVIYTIIMVSTCQHVSAFSCNYVKSGQNIGAAIADASCNSGATITLTNCVASELTFPNAMTNLKLTITNLKCGTNLAADPCIKFGGQLNGGNTVIKINGLKRKWSGSSGGGARAAVRFNAGVGVATRIKKIEIKGLDLNVQVTRGGSVNVRAIHFRQSVQVANGQSIKVIDSKIRAGSVLRSTGTGNCLIYFLFFGGSVNRPGRILEMNNVQVRGVQLNSKNSYSNIIFLYLSSKPLTLDGNANSEVKFINCQLKDNVIKAKSYSYTTLSYITSGPLSSLAKFTVSSIDMRGNAITLSAGKADYTAVMFRNSAGLQLVGSGVVTVQGVQVGGRNANKGTSVIGVLMLAVTTGLKVLSLANNVIDMSSGSGLAASGGGIKCFATVLDLRKAISVATSVTISNCKILGKYSSASSRVELPLVLARGTFSTPTLTISSSQVAITSLSAGSGSTSFQRVAKFDSTFTAGTFTFHNNKISAGSTVGAMEALYFTGAVTITSASGSVNVKNLDCGTSPAISDVCISFDAAFNGPGGFVVSGYMKRKWTGNVGGGGARSAVRFLGVVGGGTPVSKIDVRGLSLEVSVTSAAAVLMYAVFCSGTVTGAGGGSYIKLADSSMVAGSVLRSTGDTAVLKFAYFQGAISGFRAVVLQNVAVEGVTVRSGGSSTKYASISLIHTRVLTLDGSATSRVELRASKIKNNVVTSGAGWSDVQVFFTFHPVSSLRTFLVGNADMRGNTISAATHATLMAVLFDGNGPTLTMTAGGTFSVTDVLLSGKMTYGASINAPFGVGVVAFSDTVSNVNTFSVATSSINMNTGGGITTSGAASAVATIAAFHKFLNLSGGSARSISVTDCTVSGEYTSTSGSGNVELALLVFRAGAASIATLTVNGTSGFSSLSAKTTAASSGHVEVSGIYAAGNVTGSAAGGATLHLSASFQGTILSWNSWVCSSYLAVWSPNYVADFYNFPVTVHNHAPTWMDLVGHPLDPQLQNGTGAIWMKCSRTRTMSFTETATGSPTPTRSATKTSSSSVSLPDTGSTSQSSTISSSRSETPSPSLSTTASRTTSQSSSLTSSPSLSITASIAPTPSPSNSLSETHPLTLSHELTLSRPLTASRELTLSLSLHDAQTPAVPPVIAGMLITTAFLSGIGLNPVIGAQAVRTSILMATTHCGQPLTELDVAANPTRLTFSELLNYQWLAGAAIGNWIVSVLFMAVVCLVCLFVTVPSFGVSLSNCFFLTMSQIVIVGFVAVMAYTSPYAIPAQSKAWAAMLALGVATSAWHLILPALLLRRVARDLAITKVAVEPLDDEATIRERIFDYLFSTSFGYDHGPNAAVDVRIRWGGWFEHTGWLSFSATEIVCGFAMNVVAGVMMNPFATDFDCRLQAVLIVALHCPPVIFLICGVVSGIRGKPDTPPILLTRWDATFVPICWVLNFCVSIGAMMQVFEETGDGKKNNQSSDPSPFLLACGFLMGCVGCVGMLALLACLYDVWNRAIERSKNCIHGRIGWQAERRRNLQQGMLESGLLDGEAGRAAAAGEELGDLDGGAGGGTIIDGLDDGTQEMAANLAARRRRSNRAAGGGGFGEEMEREWWTGGVPASLQNVTDRDLLEIDKEMAKMLIPEHQLQSAKSAAEKERSPLSKKCKNKETAPQAAEAEAAASPAPAPAAAAAAAAAVAAPVPVVDEDIKAIEEWLSRNHVVNDCSKREDNG